MNRKTLYQMKADITYFRKYFSHRVIRRWNYALDQRVVEASTPWAIKKGATFIFAITLANVDRFQ